MLAGAAHTAFNHGFHRRGVGGERHVSKVGSQVAVSCCPTDAGSVEAEKSDSRTTRRGFLRNVALLAGGLAASSAVRSSAAPVLTRLPDFKSLTLEQQVGQMVIARQQDWPLMEKYAKQGIISGMTPSLTKLAPAEVAEFTNRFQKLSPIPLLFGWGGVSYSGGTEVRLGQTMRLGATRNAELAREAGRIEAVEARALGFQFAGAPVLDVNLNPDNTIINLRSIGDDVELVTTLGAAIAQGTLDGGAAPIFMHFPGHGATRGDSHIEMPEAARTLAELEAVELKPFAELIRRGLARVICTNHCYYPALEPQRKIPATLSRTIVTGLLREKLGYQGVIISDSLTMRPIKDNYGIEEAAIETVRAGHDLILQDYNSDPKITIDALARAVRQGRIPLAQVEQSVHAGVEAEAGAGAVRAASGGPGPHSAGLRHEDECRTGAAHRAGKRHAAGESAPTAACRRPAADRRHQQRQHRDRGRG